MITFKDVRLDDLLKKRIIFKDSEGETFDSNTIVSSTEDYPAIKVDTTTMTSHFLREMLILKYLEEEPIVLEDPLDMRLDTIIRSSVADEDNENFNEKLSLDTLLPFTYFNPSKLTKLTLRKVVTSKEEALVKSRFEQASRVYSFNYMTLQASTLTTEENLFSLPIYSEDMITNLPTVENNLINLYTMLNELNQISIKYNDSYSLTVSSYLNSRDNKFLKSYSDKYLSIFSSTDRSPYGKFEIRYRDFPKSSDLLGRGQAKYFYSDRPLDYKVDVHNWSASTLTTEITTRLSTIKQKEEYVKAVEDISSLVETDYKINDSNVRTFLTQENILDKWRRL